MDLTVVIPAYQTIDTVEQTIRSVLQVVDGVVSYEILLIDDACPLKTGAVVEQLQLSPHLEVVSLPDNVGLGEARNVGIRRARGQYVVFLDSDDYWDPSFPILSVLQQMQACSGDMFITGTLIEYSDNPSSPSTSVEYSDNNILPKRFFDTSIWMLPVLSHAQPCWSHIYNAHFLQSRELFFAARRFEDHDFVLRCLLAAKSISGDLDLTLVHYRKSAGANSLSSIAKNSAREEISYLLNHCERVLSAIANIDASKISLPTANYIKKERFYATLSRVLWLSANHFESLDLGELLKISAHCRALYEDSWGANIFQHAQAEQASFLRKFRPEEIRLVVAEILNNHWDHVHSMVAVASEISQEVLEGMLCSPYSGEIQPEILNVLQADYFQRKNLLHLPLERKASYTPLPRPRFKRVDLMVGLPKTGTTAVQAFCLHNAHKLRDQGILYPVVGHYLESAKPSFRSSGHEFLSFPDQSLPWSVFERSTPRSGDLSLLLSNENLFFTEEGKLTRTLSRLGKTGEVHIHLCLRNYKDWILSFYKELVTGGHTNVRTTFVESFQWLMKKFGPDQIARRLQFLSAAVGEENVHIHKFEDLQGEDLGQRMLLKVYADLNGKSLGLDSQEFSSNHSRINDEFLPIFLALNRAIKDWGGVNIERKREIWLQVVDTVTRTQPMDKFSELDQLRNDLEFGRFCTAAQQMMEGSVHAIKPDLYMEQVENLRKYLVANIATSREIRVETDRLSLGLQVLLKGLNINNAAVRAMNAPPKVKQQSNNSVPPIKAAFKHWLVTNENWLRRLPASTRIYHFLVRSFPNWFKL